MSWWRKAYKWGLGLASAAVLSLPVFEGVQDVHYLYNDFFPSHIRSQFAERHRVTLHGWAADIEGKPERISDISGILAKESLEGIGAPCRIRIISGSVLKRNLLDSVKRRGDPGCTVYCTPQYGRFNFYTVNIFSEGFRKEYLISAVKRIKLDLLLERDQSILDVWNDEDAPRPRGLIIEEENPRIIQASYSRPDLDGMLLDPPKPEGETRRPIRQQIADLAGMCEGYSESPEQMYRILFHPDRYGEEHEDIMKLANVEILSYYGLLPKEYLTHIYLSKIPREYPRRGRMALEAHLEISSKFLERYPGSVYEANIRVERAQTLLLLQKLDGSKEHGIQAEHELQQALLAPYRDKDTQITALNRLGDIYKSRRERQLEHDARQATLMLYVRRRRGDLNLSTEGVNPYLRARGILPRTERKVRTMPASYISQKPFK